MRVFNSLGSDNSSISHRDQKSVFVQFQNWQICLRSKKSKFEISVFRILCEVRVLFQKLVFYPCSSRVTEIQPHTRQTFVFWAVWNELKTNVFSGISRKMKFNVWHLNELRTVPHELSVLSSRVWRQELWRIPLLSTFIFQTQTPVWTNLRVSMLSTTLQSLLEFTYLVRRSDTGFHPWAWSNKPVSRFIRTNRKLVFFFFEICIFEFP